MRDGVASEDLLDFRSTVMLDDIWMGVPGVFVNLAEQVLTVDELERSTPYELNSIPRRSNSSCRSATNLIMSASFSPPRSLKHFRIPSRAPGQEQRTPSR